VREREREIESVLRKQKQKKVLLTIFYSHQSLFCPRTSEKERKIKESLFFAENNHQFIFLWIFY